MRAKIGFTLVGFLVACSKPSVGDDDVGESSGDDVGTEGDSDLPSDLPQTCEGVAGEPGSVENMPDAHGWTSSDGPDCGGDPPAVVPPCSTGSCWETLLCTACEQLSLRDLAHGGAVYVRSSARDASRFDVDTETWESLRMGAEPEWLVAFGETWIATYGSDGVGPFDLRLVDPSSGEISVLGVLLGSENAAPGLPSVRSTTDLVFDSSFAGAQGHGLCQWGMDPFSWTALVDGTSASSAWMIPSAEVYGDWIYWANERVHLDTQERQVLFKREFESAPLGFVVLDEVLWFLNASPCNGGGGGCAAGDGGLYRADPVGPASDFPERVEGVAADAYASLFSRIETDGTKLYWQRRDEATGSAPAEVVAFDPNTEQLDILFSFALGDELASYRVVGDQLYGVRAQAPGCLERLSLVP